MKATLCICSLFRAHTNWNLLVDPALKISVDGVGIPTAARGKSITDSNRVDDIVRKFKSKYREGEIKKYYTKFDVAAEVLL